MWQGYLLEFWLPQLRSVITFPETENTGRGPSFGNTDHELICILAMAEYMGADSELPKAHQCTMGCANIEYTCVKILSSVLGAPGAANPVASNTE